ncbi:hypothetical protein HYFRA_00012278 [Hymenoscyphus fraxineus]|uniref:Uncharacterized protein n=1 Tax=Hymenoscyphus fraxineus TaxID=746836 RepID=A0A9N9PK70_9HELO|nr:hypothetical protein HYFRA_00012278 [Hymenoscyphus fraxineus]
MDNEAILSRWRELDAARAKKKRDNSRSLALSDIGVSAPTPEETLLSTDSSVYASTSKKAESVARPLTMASDKSSNAKAIKKGFMGRQSGDSEAISPVIKDIFKLIDDIQEQRPQKDPPYVTESHAYAIEMELKNSRMAHAQSAKRIQELEEQLRISERQIQAQQRVIRDLAQEGDANKTRIKGLEQLIRNSDITPTAQSPAIDANAVPTDEEKIPTPPQAIKKKPEKTMSPSQLEEKMQLRIFGTRGSGDRDGWCSYGSCFACSCKPSSFG